MDFSFGSGIGMDVCDDFPLIFMFSAMFVILFVRVFEMLRSYNDRLIRAERTINTLRLLLAQTQSVIKIKSEFIIAKEFLPKKKTRSDEEFRSRWEEEEHFLVDLSFSVQEFLQNTNIRTQIPFSNNCGRRC